jgi:CrcB protein
LHTYLLIGIGGALGSIARFWCSDVMGRLFGDSFPWGTLLVNVIGSLIIGFVFTATEPDGRLAATIETRHFIMVGILGGYTTFSAFSLQTLHLLNHGHLLYASLNVVASVAFCLVAVWLGHQLALQFNAIS